MNETLNGIISWLAQALGAGVATAVAMIAAGADLTQKQTWAGIVTAAAASAWAHLRNSPLPSSAPTTGAPK